MRRRVWKYCIVGGPLLAVWLAAWLALVTQQNLRELPAALVFTPAGGDGIEIAGAADASGRGMQVLDRRGEPLNATFTDSWNLHDVMPLHEIPPFLRTAFVAAEDKRFFEHHGPDWSARFSAAWTNVKTGSAVRGASTISEQVVRMLHPRPRTVWSRWLEGWEARALERRFTKNEILEFYLNQVPYASNRRGVAQAASYYFARDLATLSRKEMLALAVLVRAPTRFDLKHDTAASADAIARLADTLAQRGELLAAERDAVVAEPWLLEAPRLAVAAPHFVEHARSERLAAGAGGETKLVTTLDAALQGRVQRMLDQRMGFLAPQRVANGAVLVVDHTAGEVLAWVVAGGGSEQGPASYIDAVTTPRQPGSALKPFLYALALDSGWTAAQIIDDAPLSESTSGGLHSYQNYSRRFYGEVALRDALGNSLNIPALKTLQHVGTEPYLHTLAALGFEGLRNHPDFYGDGIALGSGAVTLLELVQAYTALANGGTFRAVTTRFDGGAGAGGGARRVYSPEAASLVANILSDADARALEFGRDSVLAFPVQTAVKTGTSSDFRDAWAVGFNYRYAVGVWMGNLDQTPTDGVTGSTGPALLLRSVFAELTRDAQTRPLYLSPKLVRATVCVPMPLRESADECLRRDEWFMPGTETRTAADTSAHGDAIRLRQPTPGLLLAYDPRLPAESQAFEFVLQGVAAADRVRWTVDGRDIEKPGATYRWSVTRGDHRVAATVWQGGELVASIDETAFHVK